MGVDSYLKWLLLFSPNEVGELGRLQSSSWSDQLETRDGGLRELSPDWLSACRVFHPVRHHVLSADDGHVSHRDRTSKSQHIHYNRPVIAACQEQKKHS